MSPRQRPTNQQPEPYEVEAYNIGLSAGLGRAEPAVVTRRIVELDEDGRPVRLIEEVIYYD